MTGRNAYAALMAWGIAAGGPAMAAEKLVFAPAPDWVRPILTPAAPLGTEAFAPYAVLNRSLQLRFGETGDSTYWETLVQVQTPRGLAIARPTVKWDPVSDTVTINKAHIIRNGRVIDLMAQGQTFTYLRREPQLEKDILDGELTAILQPDGVEIGDIIDFAYTRTTHVNVGDDRSEALWPNIGTGPKTRRDTRFVWPSSKVMRWRLSDDMPVPTITRTADDTELSLNLDAYERPEDQERAPGRFNRFGEVQFSQFGTWSEVSALMAPYYDRAATLPANSPLKAEAAKIRALSPDPKIQAAAALHLVQQKVRYNYVMANDGGFIPPSADLTWLRRWGDCKAKTTLLIALLRELGITADPALVDTADGNGMNERLPALALFNHIFVRVTIGGQAYWLDGTISVDGGLDDLDRPDEEWALPLTAKGEDLMALPATPLDTPENERRLDLDASAGISAPITVHAEFISYGSQAFRAAERRRGVPPEESDATLREYWKRTYPWIDMTSHAETFDPVTAAMRYTVEGTARIKLKHGQAVLFTIPDDTLTDIAGVPERTPGLHAEAPVAMEFPTFIRAHVTMRLPSDGKGYEVIGAPIDRNLAGMELKRRFSLQDGVFTMDTSLRTLAPEVPLAEVTTADAELKLLSDSRVFLMAPGVDISGAKAADGSPAADIDTGDRPQEPPEPAQVPRQPPVSGDDGDISLKALAQFYSGGADR